ncbi:MAG: hypothetical protein F2839_03260 [Actinobacteria bacterium]|uniref:Unannotated protein n=1 Tax=freshwater metagenome TaxID=449393 RepID=A0A6J5Z538_9ZZZZ|nr:hypothetical protein [Actinomycetota bacterium]
MRRTVLVIGCIQGLAIVIFSVFVVINANRVHSTVGFPLAEAIIFAIFGIFITSLGLGIYRENAWALTPFILLQVFSGILATTLMQGANIQERISGTVLLASAVVATLAAVRSRRSTK